MNEFIGRKRELAVLESAFHAPESSLIPIYGRRRVGKSELILHFLRDHRGLYYLGKQAQTGLQIKEFLTVSSELLSEPLLAMISAKSWKAALTAVVERWHGPEKLIIAMDEFQWIVGASPELPSELQDLWDRRWKNSGKVILILCGSYIGFMERELLGSKSPLFGRRTAQIHLQPFGYREARLFHPGYSLTDSARTYFVCGGIPLYLRAFSPDRSFEMNVQGSLLSEFAPLFREPDFLLREELRDVKNYYAILMALSSGSAPSRDIARQSGIGDRSLSYYLNQLIELRYLRRRYPMTGARPAARHVRFVLDDALLRFWFRWIYPNMSSIMHLGAEKVFEAKIQPGIESYFGQCFESLCREALPAIYRCEGVTAAFEIGEYWNKDAQIDIVGLRDDGWTDLGECKWGSIKSPQTIVDELSAKRTKYPNPRNATIALRIFTRDPVKKPAGLPGVRWHDLGELYADER
jgi:hypothetical protein